jgi:hypothetical protein
MKQFFISRLKIRAELVAKRMTGFTERWSTAGKKTGIVLFTILSCGTSSYIIWSTLNSITPNPTAFLVKRSTIPRHIGKAIQLDNHSLISKALYDRIEAVKQNDSLMRGYPQLLDSIHAFEQSYQLQLKNK